MFLNLSAEVRQFFVNSVCIAGGKTADHADAGYCPQRPVAFAFGELLPQTLCGRPSRLVILFGNAKAAAAAARER